MSEVTHENQPDIPVELALGEVGENESLISDTECSDVEASAGMPSTRTPIFTTEDGRQIFAEDFEEMAQKGVSLPGSASSSSSTPTYKACVIADSGFGCVALAVAGFKVGIVFICAVKNAHKKFPKEGILKILKDAPSGNWALAESVVDGVPIVCAGYKYNNKKVLNFCWPKGAACCVRGRDYIATFVDHAGNRAERPVERLSVFSRYFSYSNVVDVHNQLRQHELDLEFTWVTQNCWFRLFTTLLGMTVTDAYLALKSGVHEGHKEKHLTISRFADELAQEMMTFEVDGDHPRTRSAAGRPPSSHRAVFVSADEEFQAAVNPENTHTYRNFGKASDQPGWNKKKVDYYIQRHCAECRLEGLVSKTSSFCGAAQCGEKVPLCREGTGFHNRICMTKHRKRCLESAVSEFGVGYGKRKRAGAGLGDHLDAEAETETQAAHGAAVVLI
jgi:hypothetical protein